MEKRALRDEILLRGTSYALSMQGDISSSEVKTEEVESGFKNF